MGAVETITRARIAADQKVAEAKLKQIEAELAAELAAEKERRDAAQKPIVVPVVYEYPNGKPGSQNSEGEGGFTGTGGGGYGQPEGAAAGGVMANRPGLVIFGEGGETEVGGPASFFQRIFQTLGVGAGGVGGGQAPVSIGPFYISAMTADGVKDAVDTTLIPAIVDAFRRNVRGSMTDVQNLVKG